ncbi:hypothetical protein [Psychrobacter immobilis]|uniref:hypothetical protein n=1 Tax=Psychrobacter immobilis TaxID=498 RepID=UPI00191A2FBE|nr:hypothetical protein [Psychrobacter immobilis]
MKTLTKIVTALPALALLSACATTAPTTTPNASETPAEDNMPVKDSMPDAAYDRMAAAPYTCTDGSKIMAKQSINKKQAMVNATLPKVKWTEQKIVLNGGVQGDTASYVNDSNPEAAYAWHMKGDKGIFAIKWANGKEYQVNCQI